jgi:hypothetical protein
MKTITFHVSLIGSIGIVNSLKSFLLLNDYSVQEFKTSNGLILQVKKGSDFKKLLGLGIARDITITQFKNHFTISFSKGECLYKAFIGAIGLSLFWPFFITSIVGAYKQVQLPNKIIEFINYEADRHLTMENTSV